MMESMLCWCQIHPIFQNLIPNSSTKLETGRRRRNPKKDKTEDEWLSKSMEEQTLPLGGRAVETRRRRRR
jgi:hypothetical protein